MSLVPFTGRWYMQSTEQAAAACKPPLAIGTRLPASCCSNASIVASIKDFDTDGPACMNDTRPGLEGLYEVSCNGSNPVFRTDCSENCTACTQEISMVNHECTYITATNSSQQQWYLLLDEQTCPSNVNQRCPPVQAHLPNGRFLTLPSSEAAPECKGKTVGDELSSACCTAANFEENVLFFDQQGLCVETPDIPRIGDLYHDLYVCVDRVPTYTDCGTVSSCSSKVCKTAPYQAVPGKCVYTKPLQGDQLIEWYLLMDYGACGCEYTTPAPTANGASKKGLFFYLAALLLLSSQIA